MTHEPGRPQPAGPPSGYPYPAESRPGDDHPVEPGHGGYRGEAVGSGYGAPSDPNTETRWVPLVSPGLLRPLVLAGVVVGIAGPIVLWFTVKHSSPSFAARTGFLLLLIGIGIVIASLPLLLAEAGRLERGPTRRTGGPTESSARSLGHGWTATRMLALVGVLVIFAGAYLIRPPPAVALERSTTVTNPDSGRDPGREQPGGRGGSGGGRTTPTPTPTTS